jgi:CheY-like chemotaxis protein
MKKFTLLIDNNNIDNFISEKILHAIGVHNILTLTSTTDALTFLKQTKEIPQLILLDIRFPLMDGFEFLDKFQELEIARQPIDIFILSASINPADRQKAIEKKCAGFIEKPLTTEKILQHLDTTRQ